MSSIPSRPDTTKCRPAQTSPNGAPCDTLIELYDHTHQLTLAWADDGAGGLYSKIQVELSKNVNYYLRVRGYYSDSIGQFGISLAKEEGYTTEAVHKVFGCACGGDLSPSDVDLFHSPMKANGWSAQLSSPSIRYGLISDIQDARNASLLYWASCLYHALHEGDTLTSVTPLKVEDYPNFKYMYVDAVGNPTEIPISTSEAGDRILYQFAIKAIRGFDGTSAVKSAVLPALAGTCVPGAPSMAHDTDSLPSMYESESVLVQVDLMGLQCLEGRWSRIQSSGNNKQSESASFAEPSEVTYIHDPQGSGRLIPLHESLDVKEGFQHHFLRPNLEK